MILDKFPVNKGHSLVIPKRHCTDIFVLNPEEWMDFPFTIEKTKSMLDREFKPDGYNVGMNCGETAGQTILHAHIHVIPRYRGDGASPQGGIRNFKESLVPYDHHAD